MTDFYSFGLGVGTQNAQQQWLDVFYSAPILAPSTALIDAVKQSTDYTEGNSAIALSTAQMSALSEALDAAGETHQAAIAKTLATSQQPLVATVLATDAAPSSVPEGYLKLHLLSHRLVQHHDTKLNGLFSVLHNVPWTNQGATELADLPELGLL